MRPLPIALLCLAVAFGSGCPSSGDRRGEARGEARSESPAGAPAGNPRLAPIDAREAKSTHGPYGSGACETCHERHDAASPGRAVKTTNAGCVECHEEFGPGTPIRLDGSVHPRDEGPCTVCHNPHNARRPKLQL